MSLVNKEPLPKLNGQIVLSATAGIDDKGYGFVELRFVNSSILRIEEFAQTGAIEWKFTGM